MLYLNHNILAPMPKTEPKDKFSKSKLIELLRAGCADEEIAGELSLTLNEYNTFIGKILQDDPDFVSRSISLRRSKHAKAKLNIAAKILEGDVAVSEWDLEKTHPDYNPKKSLRVELPDVALTPEEKMKAAALFDNEATD